MKCLKVMRRVTRMGRRRNGKIKRIVSVWNKLSVRVHRFSSELGALSVLDEWFVSVGAVQF